MQRLALEPTTVTIDPQWDVNCWGIGDFYGHPERGDRDDFRIVYGYVEEELTSAKPFEVIVVPGLNGWSRLHAADPRRDPAARARRARGSCSSIPSWATSTGHPFAGDEAGAATRGSGTCRRWWACPTTA